jgi:hypothetical protein
MSLGSDGTMHCGRMDIYIRGAEGTMTGLTTPFVFPQAVPGQICRAAQWIGWKRLTTTKDKTVVRPGRVVGKVLRASNSVVMVALDEAFVADPDFRETGIWRILDIPEGGGVVRATMSGTDPVVAGSHCWINRRSPTGLPFRRWAYGHAPIPDEVLARYPNTDLEQVVALAHAIGHSEAVPPRAKLIMQRLRTRYQNPICDREGCKTPYVPEDTDFILCTCCKLVFYCSEKCQVTEEAAHREWARALPDSPAPRYNPHAPAMSKVDENTGKVTDVFRIDHAGRITTDTARSSRK